MEKNKEENKPLSLQDAKAPFLGWTTDKDVLNQQREYWGAMNGINELRSQLSSKEEAHKKELDHVLSDWQQRNEVYQKYVIDNGKLIEAKEERIRELEERYDKEIELTNKQLNEIHTLSKKIDELNAEVKHHSFESHSRNIENTRLREQLKAAEDLIKEMNPVLEPRFAVDIRPYSSQAEWIRRYKSYIAALENYESLKQQS